MLKKVFIARESETTTDNKWNLDFLYFQYEWGNNTNSNVFVFAMTE